RGQARCRVRLLEGSEDLGGELATAATPLEGDLPGRWRRGGRRPEVHARRVPWSARWRHERGVRNHDTAGVEDDDELAEVALAGCPSRPELDGERLRVIALGRCSQEDRDPCFARTLDVHPVARHEHPEPPSERATIQADVPVVPQANELPELPGDSFSAR